MTTRMLGRCVAALAVAAVGGTSMAAHAREDVAAADAEYERLQTVLAALGFPSYPNDVTHYLEASLSDVVSELSLYTKIPQNEIMDRVGLRENDLNAMAIDVLTPHQLLVMSDLVSSVSATDQWFEGSAAAIRKAQPGSTIDAAWVKRTDYLSRMSQVAYAYSDPAEWAGSFFDNDARTITFFATTDRQAELLKDVSANAPDVNIKMIDRSVLWWVALSERVSALLGPVPADAYEISSLTAAQQNVVIDIDLPRQRLGVQSCSHSTARID